MCQSGTRDLKILAYLVGEPDVGGAFCLLNLLGGSVFLVLEQEDDSMDWFGQYCKSIIVDAEDLLDPEIADADVFENCRKEGLGIRESNEHDQGTGL